MAHLGDDLINLVTRELAAFARLGALSDLDLHHIGIDEIFGGDAEPAGSNLLDGRAHRVAIWQRLEPVRFMAMASVVCASREIDPNDIAPVEKRRTMFFAGSTSSIGTGRRPSSSANLRRNSPRIV